MKTFFTKYRVIGIAMLVANLFFATGSFATIKTWAGGTGINLNWTTAGNWTGGTPGAGDDVVFNTAGTLTFTTGPGANFSFNSLTISAGTVTIIGTGASRTFTLGGNAGTDFTVASGASLILGSNLSITLAANATASIDGTLTINTGRTFNTDGGSVVTTVTGSIVNTGTVTCTSAARLLMNSGSVYQHAQDGGTLPTATWATGSLLNVTGMVAATALGGLGQAFSDITWNCTSQTAADLRFNEMTAVRNLTINSTGTGSIRVSSGAVSSIPTTGNMNNFVQTGGILNLSIGTNVGTLNVAGDFTISGGTLSESGGGSGSINFTKAGTQIYTSGGTVSNTINFTVNSGSTLQMAATGTTVTGGGLFTLSSGATLGITAAEGITTAACGTGSTCGNIRTTTRTFNAAANYIYNGTAAQVTGNGLPATLTGNVTITNTAGVTPSVSTTINTPGILTVDGLFTPASGTLIAGTGTLTGTGTTQVTKTGGATNDFTDQYTIATKTLTNLTVEFKGAAAQKTTTTPYGGLKINNSNGLTLGASTTLGGTLTFTSGNLTIGSTTLTLNGAVVNTSGTFTGSATSNITIGGAAGTLNFNQTSAATRSLKNLTLNTGATATLGTVLDITAGASANTEGAVTVASGATLTTGGNLSLKSDANGTARIATSAGTISGAVTVERYVTTGFTGNRAWRFLSVPVKGQTFKAGWQENQAAGVVGTAGLGTNITSNVANATTAPTPGFDYATPNSSLLTWDVATAAWQGGTVNALVNSTANTSETTAGWLLYIRGDRAVTPSTAIGGATTTTLRTKGTLYQGSQTAVPVAAGKQVGVGNVFASAIDFTTAGLRSAGVADAFMVYDPKLAGTYGLGGFQTFSSAASWIPIPGGGSYGAAANTIIQSGQAFFVQGSTGGTITLTEACKTAGSAVVQTPPTLPELFKTSLFSTGTNTELADGNAVVFNNGYDNAVDGNDVLKMNNFGEKLALVRDSKLLALETRQEIILTDTVYFNMQNLKQQGYRLVFTAENLDHPGLLGKLIDSYTGTSSLVILNGETNYDFTVNADAGSSAAGRFTVVFYSAGPLPVTFTEIKAYQQGKNVAVEWKVSNQINIDHYEVERSADGSNFAKQTNVAATATNGGTVSYNWIDRSPVSGYNYYRVRSIGIGGDIKYSSIVNVKMGSDNPAITVYPNPVINNTIGVQFVNMNKGIYNLRLISPLGQTMHTQQYTHTGGTVTISVEPAVKLSQGIYYLEILQPDKTKLLKTITIAQ